ncbi:MAG TPA: FAD-dependent oxidoreductase [Gaiellaceae bacterium]|nr:FAD-dependent oxidoreductase [Gaiellaceae bacterium]
MPLARDPRHDVLFEPLAIGPKTLRNRFYQVPHCTGFGVQKPGAQARYRATKAEGGWAAVCTEYCAVSPDSDETPFISARLWDDGDLRALALMCEEVHEHGALAGVELHHSGAHCPRREYRLPAVAPSQLASEYLLVTPKAMELDDIRRVQADWAEAARRAREAGFDIVYVYGAHSYLPMQFLSPFYNRRTDAYGGSFENRARFWLELLELTREAVEGECAVASRIAVDALGPYGVDLEEGLAFVRAADGLVDLWDVNVGSAQEWSKDSGPSRFFPQGHQLEWTGRVREATAKPIVGVSRLTDPDRMAEIVASGVWDVIGAARPSIADPFLPRKIEEGRLDEIRECIGCNICIPKSDPGGNIGCTQNATAGEEFRRGWHPERFEPAANADRDVLVVGAGPAGMECAIVLGKRGFRRVHLVEAEDEIGGCMRWVTRLPGRGEWARVVNWRRIQLDKLGNVEVIPRTRLGAGDVLLYGAELVVVATGAFWSPVGLNRETHEPIVGADASLPHVLTPEQVMVEGKAPPGERVAVYDCDGYFTGPDLAEKLAGEGFRVDLVTSLEDVAPFAHETLEQAHLKRRLHEAGVRMHRGVVVDRVAPGLLAGLSELGERFELETDAVVLVTQRVSDDALYGKLRSDEERLAAEGIEAVHRVGDCVAPQLIADAIFDGHRLAREIDAPNPAVPLPWRRERIALAAERVGA